MPFNLDLHGKKTYVDKSLAKENWIQVSGGVGSNQKRFGTLHIFLPMVLGHRNIKLAIIFPGKGHVFEKEKHHYHPAVCVYYNKSAWATQEFILEHYDRQVHLKNLELCDAKVEILIGFVNHGSQLQKTTEHYQVYK